MTASSDNPTPGLAAFTLQERDRHIAGYLRLERRRFEVLGSWVRSITELEVKVTLARHARHHAWHASLWEQHLPHRSGYLAPHGRREDHGGLADCLEALAGRNAPTATVERLAGAYRVVAVRAVAGYSRHLAGASEVSDAAVARTGRLVLADQLLDWREGEALLQSLLDSNDAIERASLRQAELEKLVVGDTRTEPD